MRSRLLLIFSVFTIAVLVGVAPDAQQQQQQPAGGGAARGGGQGGGRGPQVPGLTLSSTSWEDGGIIPAKHAGRMGISPALSWTNTPMGTVEFVLIMNDPEPVRPMGSFRGDVLHWMVAKIPATATSLAEGAGVMDSTLLPAGARQVQRYGGPGAPATGPLHHYTLTLYALNAPLDLAAMADRAAVEAAMEGKVIGRALWVGRFMQSPAP